MILNSNNRERHSRILKTIVSVSSCNMINPLNGAVLRPVRFHDMWGGLGLRLGSQRSADGVVIDLPDLGTYSAVTNGNKAVIKFLFFDGRPGERRKQLNELSITKMMGDARIGPKVFGAVEFMLPRRHGRTVMETIRDVVTLTGNLSSAGKLNLFQPGALPDIEFCYAMIMENMYNNPKAHVTKAWEYYDFLEDILNGDNNIKSVPIQKLKNKYQKMRELGIWHGDMHLGNIMIQRIGPTSDQKYDVRIIDFGRSINVKTNLTSMTEEYIISYLGAKPVPGVPTHVNVPRYGILRRNETSMREAEQYALEAVSGGASYGSAISQRAVLSAARARAATNAARARAAANASASARSAANAASRAAEEAARSRAEVKTKAMAAAKKLREMAANMEKKKLEAAASRARSIAEIMEQERLHSEANVALLKASVKAPPSARARAYMFVKARIYAAKAKAYSFIKRRVM